MKIIENKSIKENCAVNFVKTQLKTQKSSFTKKIQTKSKTKSQCDVPFYNHFFKSQEKF